MIRNTQLDYHELPPLERLQYDFVYYSGFETVKPPSWYQPEVINTLYFPYGTNPFLSDTADIAMRYISEFLNPEEISTRILIKRKS